MRRFRLLCLLLWWGVGSLSAQNGRFIHGVASGDPMTDRVIIWTRAEPMNKAIAISGRYEMALDSSFLRVVAEGEWITDDSRDFTVKIDVAELEPNTRYYYRFNTEGDFSPTGITRTVPSGDVSALKFAVVSCNNYQHGYFTAYRYIAQKTDLHAVLHLGDYIYESFSSRRDPRWPRDRVHDPKKEIITLTDYRLRYSQYRKDPDLQEAHRVHPFITTWDDHESSNNANMEGAQGHNPEKDGDWENRLSISKKAYFEWMPIRENESSEVYRTVRYGEMADIFMLDTRIAGRDTQIYNIDQPELFDEDRSMLGNEQRAWLLNGLKNSSARWKVLGNQVVFSPLYISHVSKRIENLLLDIWDGYPAERLRVSSFLKENDIKNVVIVTGDLHVSMAFEVPLDDWNYPLAENPPEYNPQTGEGAVAVEFVTPSISSGNFDEFIRYIKPVRYLGLSVTGVKWLEGRFEKDYRRKDGSKQAINPHLKWNNLRDHGYFILTLTPGRAKADYYFLKNVRKADTSEKLKRSFYTLEGENHLRED